jgi:uncharacterized repeat protein (TIGR02543 family)
MKKVKRTVSILVCFVMLVGVFCLSDVPVRADESNEPAAGSGEETVSVNLYFSPDDTDPIGGQEVKKGGYAVQPDDPAREGMRFLGWYTDREFTAKFDFSTPVTSDIDLFARFVNESDFVRLNAYLNIDDEYPVAAMEYIKGEIPHAPYDPGQEGKIFKGWYADKEFTVPFDFSAPINKNTDIYAKFIGEEDILAVYLYFSPDDTDPIAGQEVEKGQCAVKPDDPAREGMRFMGWYTDRECTVLYDFSKPVTKDINLYAFFKSDSESEESSSKPEESSSKPEESSSKPEESSSKPEESSDEQEKEETVYLNLYLNPADEYPAGSIECVKGGIPGSPEDPAQEGKTFKGWYADKEFTAPFDFSVPLNESMDVYAKFIGEEDMAVVNLYFSPDDTDPIAGQEVEKGQPAVKPDDPAREGMTFEGWHTDKECTVLYDFSKPVTEDMNLYAKWTSDYTLKEAPAEWNGEGSLGFVVTGAGETDASYDKFRGATMDGEVLDKANYDIARGSLKLTLKEDYLKTLPAGEHILGMQFAGDVSVETVFEIKQAETLPDSSAESSKAAEISKAESSEAEADSEPDGGSAAGNSHTGLWAAIAAVVLAAMGGTAFFITKKKKGGKKI